MGCLRHRKTKVGLITLADVDYAENPSDSERFASETYYAAHQRVRFDLQVLWRWLMRKLFKRHKECPPKDLSHESRFTS